MADNTAQQGTDTIATDDIGGVKHQRVKVEFGVDGSATDVSASNPLPVTLASIAAADRTTDSITASLQTGAVMNSLTALTVKYAKANIAASTTDGAVVAAVTSKKIRVLGFRLHAGGTATNCTFTTKPAGAGTAATELFAIAANGGRSETPNPHGHFETNSGEGLSLTTGTGSTVGVGVVYVEV